MDIVIGYFSMFKLVCPLLLAMLTVCLTPVRAEDAGTKRRLTEERSVLKQAEEQVRRNPKDIGRRAVLSTIYRGVGESEVAEKLNRETLTLPGGKTPVVCNELVQSVASQSRYEEAMALVNQYLKEFPHEPALLMERAYLWERFKKPEKRLADCNDALSHVKPADKELTNRILALRAQIYFGEKDWSNALNDFNSCIAAAPKGAHLYARRGRCLIKLGKFKEGLADLDACIRLAPGDLEPYEYRCEYFENSHQYKKAIADLTVIIDNTHNGMHKEYFERRMKLFELTGQKALANKDKATLKEFDAIMFDAFKPLKYDPSGGP